MSITTPAIPPQDIYLPTPATLVASHAMTDAEMYFRFEPDHGASLDHMPGQFAEVSLPGFGEAPISISSAPDGGASFEMVVRKIGRLTSAMHDLLAGDKVGIRGPYGTHMPVDSTLQGKHLIFVAGGIGLVPLRSAIQYVLQRREDYGPIDILIGMRRPADRLFIDELEKWAHEDDVRVLETVDHPDDTWQGYEGVITTLLPEVSIDPASTIVALCGPPIMYKFVLFDLREMGLPAENTYLSLERHMKCGVGKCGHCQINGIYACRDGPIFNLAEIQNVDEAI